MKKLVYVSFLMILLGGYLSLSLMGCAIVGLTAAGGTGDYLLMKSEPRTFQFGDHIEFKNPQPKALKIAEEIGKSMGYETVHAFNTGVSYSCISMDSKGVRNTAMLNALKFGLNSKDMFKIQISLLNERELDINVTVITMKAFGGPEEAERAAKTILADFKSKILAKIQESTDVSLLLNNRQIKMGI